MNQEFSDSELAAIKRAFTGYYRIRNLDKPSDWSKSLRCITLRSVNWSDLPFMTSIISSFNEDFSLLDPFDRLTRWPCEIPYMIKLGKETIGLAGLSLGEKPKSSKCMVAITDRSKWGRGYGKTSLECLLEIVYHYQDIEHIQIEYVDYNIRAKLMSRNLGFVGRDLIPRGVEFKGKYYDVYTMEISRKKIIKAYLDKYDCCI